MGTDLLTSSRGPGVIGALIALTVLVGFAGLAFFAFDPRFQGGGKTIEGVISDDAKRLDNLQARVAGANETLGRTDELKRIESETLKNEAVVKTQQTRIEEERGLRDEGREALARGRQSFADYRQRYRDSAREAMKGREFERIELQSGEVYQQVKVTEVDAARMQIRHSGGITGLPIEQLPADLLDFLQYDEEEKAQHLADEASQRSMQHGVADVVELQQDIARLNGHIERIRKTLEKGKQDSARSQDAVKLLQQAIKEKRRELAANESGAAGPISRAPAIRGEIAQLQRKLDAAKDLPAKVSAEATKLRAELGELERNLSAKESALEKRVEEIKAQRESGSGDGNS